MQYKANLEHKYIVPELQPLKRSDNGKDYDSTPPPPGKLCLDIRHEK